MTLDTFLQDEIIHRIQLINVKKLMSLSSHRKHKIYIAATMGYGLGSEDPEELALYEMIKKDIEKDSKNRNMGIQRTD